MPGPWQLYPWLDNLHSRMSMKQALLQNLLVLCLLTLHKLYPRISMKQAMLQGAQLVFSNFPCFKSSAFWTCTFGFRWSRLCCNPTSEGGLIVLGQIQSLGQIQFSQEWPKTIKPKSIGQMHCTEGEIKVCTWLREISSCSCLTILPGPAWVLLSKTYKPLFPPLYTCLQRLHWH